MSTHKTRKYKSREEVCALFYASTGMAKERPRRARDGSLYKARWLTRKQTAWLLRSRAENKAPFYVIKRIPQWRGAFRHKGKIISVWVKVAPNGASLMRCHEHSQENTK